MVDGLSVARVAGEEDVGIWLHADERDLVAVAVLRSSLGYTSKDEYGDRTQGKGKELWAVHSTPLGFDQAKTAISKPIIRFLERSELLRSRRLLGAHLDDRPSLLEVITRKTRQSTSFITAIHPSQRATSDDRDVRWEKVERAVVVEVRVGEEDAFQRGRGDAVAREEGKSVDGGWEVEGAHWEGLHGFGQVLGVLCVNERTNERTRPSISTHLVRRDRGVRSPSKVPDPTTNTFAPSPPAPQRSAYHTCLSVSVPAVPRPCPRRRRPGSRAWS